MMDQNDATTRLPWRYHDMRGNYRDRPEMQNSDDHREPVSAMVNQYDDASKADEVLERHLREAWANRQFELAYQPQFDLLANRIFAFEALLRWPHPVLGNVPPDTFIPVAEATGLIDEISEWVLKRACREATRWPDDVSVAVNLSAGQIRNTTLPAVVAAALNGSGLAASRLELEITEGSQIPADGASLDALHSIRGTGVRIVMDDFGTGYSALGYLVAFPFDKLKMDRYYTARLSEAEDGSEAARAIVRALVGLCKELGIKLVAEGVETPDQLLFLRDAQCTEIQGFLCGYPQPAESIPDTLAKAPRLFRDMFATGAEKVRGSQVLWSENAPFSQIAEHLNDIVIVTNSNLVSPGPSIVYVNPAFTRLTGYSAAETIGQSPRMLQGPGTSRATLTRITSELQGGRPVHEKILNFAKSGAPYWLDLQIVALRDRSGAISHFAAVQRDITLDKRRLDELEYLADRDTLTGIPNRRAFLRVLSSEIESATIHQIGTGDRKGPCLVFVDVDHFKKVNDELGHAIGDAVLCGIADCLVQNVRRVDMIGRVGGEEFAVCMPAIGLQEARGLAIRLRDAVAATALATPAGPLKMTVSIGVACFKLGDSADALTARADAAMYAAKRAGRNRVRSISVL